MRTLSRRAPDGCCNNRFWPDGTQGGVIVGKHQPISPDASGSDFVHLDHNPRLRGVTSMEDIGSNFFACKATGTLKSDTPDFCCKNLVKRRETLTSKTPNFTQSPVEHAKPYDDMGQSMSSMSSRCKSMSNERSQCLDSHCQV